MDENFIGEIQLFAGHFAPLGWLTCEGQLLSIEEHIVLFSLIKNTYGGDGVTTFAVPDLRGRAPMGQSPEYPLGQVSGSETVTILPKNLPTHGHDISAKLKVSAEKAEQADPSGHYWATSFTSNGQPDNEFSTIVQEGVTMNAQITSLTMGEAGGNQPVNNMQPFQSLTFIIALQGVFPTQD